MDEINLHKRCRFVDAGGEKKQRISVNLLCLIKVL